MIIREVHLENVKSYGSPATVIQLTHGVNAICGENGSGKSTILEAIGCALFQHLPYRRHEDFVREGETSGTITVVIESRLDQRLYEVVRRVGRGPAHYVYDPDIRQYVARGADDVRLWLQKHWGLLEQVALPELFVNAVGPPQGTLTAVFLDTPSVRRSKFDPLLRVDEYEDAYRHLSVVESTLVGEQNKLSSQIQVLSYQAAERPKLEERRTAIREEKADLADHMGRLSSERMVLDRILNEFDHAERIWRTATTALEVATERSKHAAMLASRARDEHARAAEAAGICKRSQAGRDAYVDAEQNLKQLEIQVRERDGLLQQRHNLELRITEVQSRISRVEEELARCEKAIQDLVALQAKIPEQERAEAKRQDALAMKSEADQLRRSLPSLSQQVERVRKRVLEGERAVAEAEAAHARADEVPVHRARYEELGQALAATNRAEGEQKQLRASLADAQRNLARLRHELADVDQRLALCTKSQDLAAKLAMVEPQQRTASEERAAAAAQLHHAQATRVQVAGGLCPFLHETCRNLRPGITLETHFDSEVERWSRETRRLDASIRSYDTELQTIRQAVKQTEEIPALRERKQRLDQDIQATEAAIVDQQQRIKEASELASRRTETERDFQAAHRALREAEQALQLYGRVVEYRRAIQEAHAEREGIEAQIASASQRLAELKDVDAQLADAIATLNALGSPRERTRHLQADAEKVTSLRTNHERLVAARAQIASQREQIDHDLDGYSKLDSTIGELRSLRDRCRADYETYLAALPLANRLAEHAVALTEAERNASEASSAVAEAQKVVDLAATAYDEAAHHEAITRRDEVTRAIGDAQGRIETASQEEDRLNDQLAKVHQAEQERAEQKQSLESIEDERQFVEFLRRSIRAAGPEITRQLLARISRTASMINADILNQSAIDLEWASDYEIVTRRSGESRTFAQLSGGEQMAAALAVRLAILRDLSNVRVAFLDEPTAHLDQERRSNLGDQVQRLQGFDQLVVISHDDTFDGLFGHVIHVRRANGQSQVSNDI